MVEDIKDADKRQEKQDEDRIALLEKRIRELENTANTARISQTRNVDSRIADSNIHVEGLVENVVGQFIPGLGGILKALEASSPEFRQKIADTDAEIKHRIDVGWSNKPVVDYHVSTRPIRRGPGKPAAPRVESVNMPSQGPVREPIVDVLDGKEGITVIAELPGVSEDDLNIKLDQTDLQISAGKFCKNVTLPHAAKEILEKSYKNGILQIKLN
ncbi:MAG TPA: Hsp20/alpha crystallin family protein [Methanothrix sp.]|jgi:HSP20 family molecular chaperone IbpA|nr:Hsp20/alpha crystallin family protein [Methanothrix sp.]